MDDSETVWVEREHVGHGFRDDDLSRLRTERVVFDECYFGAGERCGAGQRLFSDGPAKGRRKIQQTNACD